MKLETMQVWAILDPERYIKKSIKDWSLAIYDDQKSAGRQIKSISDANHEECFVEELALCNKVRLDAYIKVYNEMYQKLDKIAEATVYDRNYETVKPIFDLLAKARGENQ